MSQAFSEFQMKAARVLVVEDEALIRMTLAEELRDGGFAVVEAENAEDAWQYLQEGETVDLVFTDVRMPGAFDGIGLAHRVRRTYPDLAIILTSGHLSAESAVGLGGFVSKPYALTRVTSLVRDALAQHA